ncbi:MAG TPA: hypothetical protein VNV86_16695, partial [Candidatus Acidoferrum sp.]|nr:hypothetical protein [Candidatus Acidoferrum sp.]
MAVLALAALFLACCASRPAASKTERIAVLRFENLSPDASLSWVGRALSEVVSVQLAGASGLQTISSQRLHSYDRLLGARPVSSPGISTESTQALLAGATRVVYGEYTVRSGKLEARVTIEDARGERVLKTIAVAAPSGDVLRLADEIARAIEPKSAAFSTRSPEALSAYIHALESAEPTRVEQGMRAAIQADPDFPPPYRLLAQERAQRGDPAGAAALIEQALGRGDRIAPLERARLELQVAEITGDLNGRQEALTKLVALDAGDPVSWRALGETLMNRHEYRRAVDSLKKAADLEPGDAAAWNSLGYAAAYAGDLTAGAAALRRYQTLAPAEANPLDSLGDIHLASGKLAEAEKFYLEAFQKDPNFLNQGDLLKAAIARLYSGDVASADEAAKRYFDARAKANDPILAYRQAQWLWLTGRRKDAYKQMQAFADANENTPLRDTSSRAYAEISLWSLMLGDRAAAKQLAEKAVRISSPAARGNAIVAAFLALPPVAA